MSGVVSVDPYLGERVFSAPATGAAAVADAVGRAAAAQVAWAARPVAERARILHAFADAVEAGAARLRELLVREIGKRRADADGEVAWTARSARFYADHPPGEERAAGARVLRRPIASWRRSRPGTCRW
jgi:acyl-CoA reductase-like NAD-dependent aldehyde dehydrogenase